MRFVNNDKAYMQIGFFNDKSFRKLLAEKTFGRNKRNDRPSLTEKAQMLSI